MIRKIIFFLCISIAVSSLCQRISYAEGAEEKTIEAQSGLYYTIEKGDTLWDISERFFDSPWVWPELWEKNSRITNPHWIEPGEQIRLFSREESQAVVEPEPEPEPEPDPEETVQPKEPPYYLYPAIKSVGFLRKKPVTPSGAIFKVKGGKVMISEGDQVYVRPVGNVVYKPGDRFSVYRTMKSIKRKIIKGRKTRKHVQIPHLILGVVEITDVQPKFSMGSIIESFRTINLNDLLMPYKERSPKIILTESKKGLEGKIIAAEGGETIFGDHAVVFIDKGRKHGIQVGQSYNIYYQEKERIDPGSKREVLLPPVDFGRILILHTEETTATAVVTRAEKSIQAGAKIHAPSH